MEEDEEQLGKADRLFLEGFHNLYGQLRTTITGELSRRNHIQTALLNRISELVKENQVLKAQIPDISSPVAQPAAADRTISEKVLATYESTDALIKSPTKEIPPLTVPYAEHANLSAKFDSLQASCLILQANYSRLKAKFDEAKSLVKQWQQYAEAVKRRKTKSPAELSDTANHIQVDSTAGRSDWRPASLTALGSFKTSGLPPSLSPPRPKNSSEEKTGNSSPAPAATSELEQRTIRNSQNQEGEPNTSTCLDADLNSFQNLFGSSQVTEDDADENGPTASSPAVLDAGRSSDPYNENDIEFLFTRPVKRKRGNPSRDRPGPQVNTIQASIDTSCTKIKKEPSYDELTMPSLQHQPACSPALDLDNDKLTLKTPKKRRFLGNNPNARSHVIETETSSGVRDRRSDSPHHFPNAVPSASMEGLIRKDTERLAPQTFTNTAHDDQPYEPNITEKMPWTAEADGPLIERNSPDVLRPISPNTALLPRVKPRSGPSKLSTNREVNAISEDGESSSTSIKLESETPSSQTGSLNKPNKSEAQRRLQSPLGRETPATPGLSIKRTPSTAKINTAAHGFDQRMTRSAPIYNKRICRNSGSTPDIITSSTVEDKSPCHTTPRQAVSRFDPHHKPPLRLRPVEQLRASDFRPNPKFNQGLDYVFSETVRTREGRRCLPGCTRSDCCGGTFRAMIDAGVSPTIQRGLFDTPQDVDADDDDRLLRCYLGDAYVAGMPPDYRSEMLARAKTELLANRIGRHRQAYVRQKSPPGFWRADMPSTQELERDREEARRQEQIAVQDMYREAMREDGRWVFKDELKDRR